MIRAEIPGKRLPGDHLIEHPTQRQTVHIANVDSKSYDAPGEVIHYDENPMGL
jgi:hypothetical protein